MDSIWVIVIIGIIIRVLGNSAKKKKASQNQGGMKTPQQLEAERRSAEARRRNAQGSFAQQRMDAENNRREDKLSKEQRIESKIEAAKAQEAAKQDALESRWGQGARPYDAPPGRRQVGKKSSGSPLDEILREIKEEVLKEIGASQDTQEREVAPVQVESFETAGKSPHGMGFPKGPHEARAELCKSEGSLDEGECYDPYHRHKPLTKKPGEASPALSYPREEMCMNIFQGEGLSQKDILSGIVMLEVLGPPKALRNIK